MVEKTKIAAVEEDFANPLLEVVGWLDGLQLNQSPFSSGLKRSDGRRQEMRGRKSFRLHGRAAEEREGGVELELAQQSFIFPFWRLAKVAALRPAGQTLALLARSFSPKKLTGDLAGRSRRSGGGKNSVSSSVSQLRPKPDGIQDETSKPACPDRSAACNDSPPSRYISLKRPWCRTSHQRLRKPDIILNIGRCFRGRDGH